MTFMYDAPGRADALGPALREQWNTRIVKVFDDVDQALGGDPKARFLRRDPRALKDAKRRAVEWPSDPLQATVCAGRPAVGSTAQALCDWGAPARPALHREYCEYVVVPDRRDPRRPKRVEITTELREYWLCVATHAPDQVRGMATETLGLGREPSWEELYGFADPHDRSPEERAQGFLAVLAGTDADPTGRLNTDRALFMRSSINDLDDVLGIAMQGARLFAARVDGGLRPASWEEILASLKRQDLACNHADPTILLGVQARAFDGEEVALEDPIGIYIQPPNLEVFSYRDEPIPEDWVRLGRGRPGMYQRLVFGPPDDHEACLDDITVAAGTGAEPLSGGYQLLREITVEVRLVVARRAVGEEAEVRIIEAEASPSSCGTDGLCASIEKLASLKAETEGAPA